MNNKAITNIAFIILIVLLFVSAIKKSISIADNAPAQEKTANIYADFLKKTSQKSDNDIVLKDFPKVGEATQKKDTAIDRSTAMKYIKTRQLNGTEILELGKVKKLSDHLTQRKKIIIYTSKGSDKDTQAFLEEFFKTRKNFAQNTSYVFIPMENLWNITEDEIKDTHDRVIYQLKKDCGLFCIINGTNAQLLKMKGSNVNKKSAEIIDVILKGM